MFNLSGSEIIFILLLALVVLGPEKLPDALRRAGRTYAELKKMGTTFQSEVRGAFDEPIKEMRETADMLRKAATFDGDGDGDGDDDEKPRVLLRDPGEIPKAERAKNGDTRATVDPNAPTPEPTPEPEPAATTEDDHSGPSPA